MWVLFFFSTFKGANTLILLVQGLAWQRAQSQHPTGTHRIEVHEANQAEHEDAFLRRSCHVEVTISPEIFFQSSTDFLPSSTF
jgi:hypothetical protein